MSKSCAHAVRHLGNKSQAAGGRASYRASFALADALGSGRRVEVRRHGAVRFAGELFACPAGGQERRGDGKARGDAPDPQMSDRRPQEPPSIARQLGLPSVVGDAISWTGRPGSGTRPDRMAADPVRRSSSPRKQRHPTTGESGPAMPFLMKRGRPLARRRNKVSTRSASQPIAGQQRTSDLATKIAGARAARTRTSSQET